MRSSRGTCAIAVALAVGACSSDGSGSGNVTLRGGPDALSFVAAQDGDGAWTVITPSANGTYSFPVTGSTYGIVAVCEYGDSPATTVLQATVEETKTPSIDCVHAVENTAVLNGTLAGTLDQTTVVTAAYEGIGGGGSDHRPYSLMVPDGMWDVFATRGPSLYVAERLIRSEAVPFTASAATTLDFDFATQGVELESHAVQFAGLDASERTSVASALRNKPGNTRLEFSLQQPTTYRALPAGELRGEEMNVVTATAFKNDGTARHVRRWLTAAEDFTATLPAPPLDPLVESEATTPYLRLRVTIPGDVDMDRFDVVYSQANVFWTANLSRGYREATGETTYTLPDVSALAGFDPSWGLVDGGVDYDIVTLTSTATSDQLFRTDVTAAALAGRTDTLSERLGTFGR